MESTNNAVAAAANAVSSNVEHLKQKLVDFSAQYGISVVGAIIILIIGSLVARWIGKILGGLLEKQQLEPPVRALLVRVVKLVVMAFTLVMVLDKFGVPITTLVAGIGVAGVGAGLAMQGVLSNLVAGLTIIFTKPFRVGEYVQLAGVEGQVKAIAIFSTTLLHADQSRVVIPNRKIVGEILHNYGNIRQLDLSVGVGYGSDIKQVLALLEEILKSNPRVLKSPTPGLGVSSLGDCSITVVVRPWTSVADYGPAGAEIYQAIIDRFREQKIEIPFPQREVRVLGSGGTSLAG
jgi:small conductance mechanosensitive channel